jgi:hypothetical protein
MEIGLAGCTKSKRDGPSQPKELYMKSSLFRKRRKYCERHHDEWYILSAKYGLLDPDGPPIDKYDQALSDASAEEKREWGRGVAGQLQNRKLRSETLVFHAGRNYYEPVLETLEEPKYELPTEGLRPGEMLQWYNQQFQEDEERNDEEE